MEGTRVADENAVPRLVPAKQAVTAQAAAATAVGRRRAALQTLTNVSRPPLGNANARKDAKPDRIAVHIAPATSSTSSAAVNRQTSTRIADQPAVSASIPPPAVPDSDDTVEEETYEDYRSNRAIDTDDDDDMSGPAAAARSTHTDNNLYTETDIADSADDTPDDVDDILLHDLTEPTALASANFVNDSVTNPDALFPVWSQADKEELRRAYYDVRSRPGVFDDEDEDTYDVSMVVEYGDDIFAYMRQLEVRMRPNPGYMDAQTEIHWSMRAILVDWLVQVHHRFNLLPETLFLTINYIDRFLSIKTVSLSKFQLVGAVALFLAAKYEEINCPSVQEIVYMVDNGYSVDEILKAERYMVDLLDFNLGWPGPMSFLRRTSKADDYDLETRTLAKYILEVSIMDERFVGALPSWTAAAAHCLARRMLGRGPWTPVHVYFSGYTLSQLEPAIASLQHCCESPTEHHKAIFEKYSDRKFKKAALFVADYMQQQRPPRQQSR